jgi:hypothetical protein
MKLFSCLIFLFFSLLTCLTVNAQEYWSRRFDLETGNDYGTTGVVLEDGIVIPSKSFCENNTRECTGLLKIDYEGNLSWRTVIYDTLDFEHYDAIGVRNDTIFMNTSYIFEEDGSDFIILEFDAQGNAIGQFNYNYPFAPSFRTTRELLVDHDRIYVSFAYRDTMDFKYREKIRAYDASWNQLWEVLPSSYYNQISHMNMEATADTGMVVIVASYSPGKIRSSIVRLDKNGQEQWVTHFPYSFGSYGDYVTIAPHPDGSYFGTWQIDYWESGILNASPDLAFKLNATGQFVWQKIVNKAQNFWDIFITQNGDVIGCGYSRTEVPDEEQITTGYVDRMNTDGETIWERRYVDSTNAALWGNFDFGLELPNGDLIFGGSILDTSSNGSDVWVVRVDSNGCFTPNCAGEFQVVLSTPEPGIQVKTDVFAIYLNPFTDRIALGTVLGRHVPEGRYCAALYDLHGRVVHSPCIVQPNLLTEFDMSDQPPGMYVMQVFLNGVPVQVLKAVKGQ